MSFWNERMRKNNPPPSQLISRERLPKLVHEYWNTSVYHRHSLCRVSGFIMSDSPQVTHNLQLLLLSPDKNIACGACGVWKVTGARSRARLSQGTSRQWLTSQRANRLRDDRVNDWLMFLRPYLVHRWCILILFLSVHLINSLLSVSKDSFK